MLRKYRKLSIVIILLVMMGLYWPARWQYVVIHHSGGRFGNNEHLQKVHDERQPNDPVNAIAYHYIIGNGDGMEDGAVDHDIRKTYNLWGGHVRSINFDENFRGIGICVIGDLDKGHMTDKQFTALVELTRDLISRYGIAKENILFHGEIEHEHTACPGKHFPKKQFLEAL